MSEPTFDPMMEHRIVLQTIVDELRTTVTFLQANPAADQDRAILAKLVGILATLKGINGPGK